MSRQKGWQSLRISYFAQRPGSMIRQRRGEGGVLGENLDERWHSQAYALFAKGKDSVCTHEGIGMMKIAHQDIGIFALHEEPFTF